MSKCFISTIKKSNFTYVVFYNDWCGYSMKALKLLNSKNIPYKQCTIDEMDDINNINDLRQKFVQEPTLNYDLNHKTIPFIFKNGVFLGGTKELEQDLAFGTGTKLLINE
jgi:glutaredoxin